MIIALVLAFMLLQTPNSVLDQIGIDQRLGESVDPFLVLRDETGKEVTLGSYFGAKPILLTPVYFNCPMLCGMQMHSLAGALKIMPFRAGKDFEVVSFSIDPNEG